MEMVNSFGEENFEGVATDNTQLDSEKDKEQIKTNGKQLSAYGDQVKKYEKIRDKLVKYDTTSESYLAGFKMQDNKVQLRQINCAISSMSSGYQGNGMFKCKDIGWTKDVNDEWYSEYMHSDQRKQEEFWMDPVGNAFLDGSSKFLQSTGEDLKVESKKARKDGRDKCMEAGGINKSRTGYNLLKKGKKLGNLADIMLKTSQFLGATIIKSSPVYIVGTLATTYRAHFMRNKMKGETDKQAGISAAGDVAIDKVSNKAGDKLSNDSNRGMLASAVITNEVDDMQEGWEKFVKKHVY